MKLNRIFLTFVIVVIFIAVVLFIDYQYIENLVIPDICAYHSVKSTSILFDLFYCFPASAGGHPSPTIFHVILTIFIGGILGFFVSKRILKNL